MKKEKHTLVIDNIDSFVYNLVQYVGALGGNPIVFQNTVDYTEIRKEIDKRNITHIIISPGPKTPAEAGISNKIIKEYGPKIPTLGVCLGHQCIGYTYKGIIRKARKPMHGKTSPIQHNQKDIFQNIENPLQATRYHSLVISKENLPKCLEITARSLDDNEIMAIKHKKYPIYGIQFHPESILTKNGIEIIKNFLNIKK